MLGKKRVGQLTSAFLAAIAAFVVLRVLLPGILMGVLSLGSAYMARRLGGVSLVTEGSSSALRRLSPKKIQARDANPNPIKPPGQHS
jgi:hypothetical protein